mmetsp:Transcript_6026/g.19678  ORF Transcript_6026/g.19678 Transcript_6026/m.19678 type:complete len:274 (-) Transcript_6026:164-985(-)
MQRLSTQSWYRPKLDRAAAERLLALHEPGAFVVRPSTTQPGLLAISHNDRAHGPGHLLIRPVDDSASLVGFALVPDSGTLYPTIERVLIALGFPTECRCGWSRRKTGTAGSSSTMRRSSSSSSSKVNGRAVASPDVLPRTPDTPAAAWAEALGAEPAPGVDDDAAPSPAPPPDLTEADAPPIPEVPVSLLAESYQALLMPLLAKSVPLLVKARRAGAAEQGEEEVDAYRQALQCFLKILVALKYAFGQEWVVDPHAAQKELVARGLDELEELL